MKRKFLALTLGVSMLLATVGCGNPGSQASSTSSTNSASSTGDKKPIVLKLAYEDPTSSSYHVGFKYFADTVEQRSNGEVKVELYSDAQLGNAVGTIEGVKMGTIEMTHTTTAALSNFIPEFGAVDAPFVFANAEEAHAAMDGAFGKHLSDLALKQQNIRILGFTDVGFRNIFSKKPASTLADLSGAKIRTQEAATHLATFSALGMLPTPMAYSEIYTALSQGTIDAAENNYSSILNMKFYEVAPYIIETGHFYGFCAVSMSEKKFQSLSPEHQEIILTAFDEAIDVQRKALVEIDNAAYKKLVDDHGVKVIKLDHEQLVTATESVYKDKADILTPELMKLLGR